MGGGVVVVAGAAGGVVAGGRDRGGVRGSPGAAPPAGGTLAPPAASPRSSADRLPEHVELSADVPITLPEPSSPALATERMPSSSVSEPEGWRVALPACIRP